MSKALETKKKSFTDLVDKFCPKQKQINDLNIMDFVKLKKNKYNIATGSWIAYVKHIYCKENLILAKLYVEQTYASNNSRKTSIYYINKQN